MVLVVGMEEESDGEDVHEKALGEGECFSGEAGHALAQGEVEPFDVVGLPFLLEARLMLFGIKNLLISQKKVAVTEGVLVD